MFEIHSVLTLMDPSTLEDRAIRNLIEQALLNIILQTDPSYAVYVNHFEDYSNLQEEKVIAIILFYKWTLLHSI